MPPRVLSSCPNCHAPELELSPADITLHLCLNRRALTTYTFRCPECRLLAERPTDECIIGMLVPAGVVVASWSIPEEFFEPHHGPVICPDDILDFCLALTLDDDLATSAAAQ